MFGWRSCWVKIVKEMFRWSLVTTRYSNELLTLRHRQLQREKTIRTLTCSLCWMCSCEVYQITAVLMSAPDYYTTTTIKQHQHYHTTYNVYLVCLEASSLANAGISGEF